VEGAGEAREAGRKERRKAPARCRPYEMGGGGAESWVETRPHVKERARRCERGVGYASTDAKRDLP